MKLAESLILWNPRGSAPHCRVIRLGWDIPKFMMSAGGCDAGVDRLNPAAAFEYVENLYNVMVAEGIHPSVVIRELCLIDEYYNVVKTRPKFLGGK